MQKRFITLLTAILISMGSFAGEGMWIPSLLSHFNIDDMHEKGFRLSAGEIYSINNSSLKDAVIIFGGGCTAELISDQGLIITNHHCGYRRIQSHSTVENNYLKNGFWAENRSQELSNPGLTATFLVRIEDVTEKVLKDVKKGMSETERQMVIDDAIHDIEKEAIEGKNHEAVTKPFYYGNEYYMFIYKTYKDLRLVGAPPSSIGKFGRDTDNWMWPRHTGDFSLFRIYADENNEPAEYSEENVPYQPKKYMKISLKGFEKGDFTMVMGYPGSTEQYLTSHAVKLITETRNPHRIKLRDIRLEVMEKYMDKSEAIKIKYAAKQSGVSNSWKRWKGEIRGLKRYKAIEKKRNLEENFVDWAESSKKNKKKYGDLVESFEEVYDSYKPYALSRDYFIETGYRGIELSRFAYRFRELFSVEKEEVLKVEIDEFRSSAREFYKDYVVDIDREICPKLLKAYHDNISEQFHPEVFAEVEEEYAGSFVQYAQNMFNQSLFTDSSQFFDFLDEYKLADSTDIMNDPAYKLAESFWGTYRKEISPGFQSHHVTLDSLYRIYVQGLRDMTEDEVFWPDANFTMRVAYGQVKGYEPRDAVKYHYQTTLDGVIQKNRKGIKDYAVPDKLKELYEAEDFGRYAMKSGEMPVCFIATNHTSGGNSGSPVLNANGHLIGVNFDRNWEGTMSDIMYDPSQCRNITLDIRYALFIIDKFAGASHLIDEMDIIY